MARTVAYVARGKLFIKEANDPAREIERTSSPPSSSGRMRVSGLARGRAPGELLYALDTHAVNGVFARAISRDAGGEEEQRIFHSEGHRVHHLHARGDKGFVACDVVQEDGSASIAILQADGSDMTILTDGKARDLAPRWIPGEDRTLVYQSAQGGTGPFAIRKIDLRKQALETLATSESLDFLAPQIASDGALYFIARPYSQAARSLGAVVWATLVLLARRVADFVRSVLARLRAGSLGGSSRTPNNRPKNMEDTRIDLWGSIVDLGRRAQSGDDTPAIVPPTWRLCRRPPGAAEVTTTVAKGVVSFDLDDRGGLVFTNGRAIYAIEADGTKTRLCTGDAIEQVALLN